MKSSHIAGPLLLTAALSLPLARAQEISSDVTKVIYDAASASFSLTDVAGGRVFVAQGRLDGVEPATPAVMRQIADPVFGGGSQLAMARADGGEARLEVYPGLPFVMVRQTVRNNGDAVLDIRHSVPATFTVCPAEKAGGLMTMGTAGLQPAHKNPGSYLFLTAASPATREGVVTGWLTHERGDGVLFSSVNKAERIEFKAQLDYGHLRLPVGKSAVLETLLIGHFADARVGQEKFADAIKRQYHIQLHPQVNGYCTWYSEVGGLLDAKGGAGACNEKDIVKLADFAARELKPFGFSFIQIDDEWQDGATNPDGSRINGPRRGFTRHKPDGPYPSGMAATAKNLRDRGLTSGIWFLPFAGNHQDKDFPKDWFMQRRDGMPYETSWGGTSYDLTKPEVQDYVRNLAKTIHGWGFNYFKMDGMWTGTSSEQVYVNDGYTEDDFGNNKPFHNPDTTNIEALRIGLKTLREGAGPDVFFSGCCAPQNMRSLGGVIGLVDAMRIGPDNGAEWQDWRKETMRFEGGGLITGPIRANRLYFLHGRVWWNDPDPAYVRPAIKLEHATLLASWVAVSGAFNLSSDWLPNLPAERLNILKRCMPSHKAQARPVDYFDTPMPSIWLLSDASQSVRRDVLGLYNWDSTDRSIGYAADKAGLDRSKTYHVFDFWAKKPEADFTGEFQFAVPKESCRILAVRAAENHPVLVSTSRHVTQGIVDVSDESWRDGTLSATSQVVGADPYELRIAGMSDGGHWRVGKAQVSAADQAAGVTIEKISDDEGWLRLVIHSKDSRTVKWAVGFTK